MISLSAKVKLGFNGAVVSINPDRWSNQHGWGFSVTVRLLCLVEFKVSVTRAYGKENTSV